MSYRSATRSSIPQWATKTMYPIGAEVNHSGLRFRCVQTHTSGGSFFADLSRWESMTGTAYVKRQEAHGFSPGDVVYDDGPNLELARADSSDTLSHPPKIIVGVGTNHVLCAFGGRFDMAGHGLAVGTTYYLSPTAAGALTPVEPTQFGHWVVAVLRPTSPDSVEMLGYAPSRINYKVAQDGASLDLPDDINVADTVRTKNSELSTHEITPVAGVATMDWNDGDAQTLSLTEDVTLTLANERHAFMVLTVFHDSVDRQLTINDVMVPGMAGTAPRTFSLGGGKGPTCFNMYHAAGVTLLSSMAYGEA